MINNNIMDYFVCKDIITLIRTSQSIIDWDFLSVKLEWSDSQIISEFKDKINWKLFSKKLGIQYGLSKKHIFKEFYNYIDWKEYDYGTNIQFM
jgi:hypothetical protein